MATEIDVVREAKKSIREAKNPSEKNCTAPLRNNAKGKHTQIAQYRPQEHRNAKHADKGKTHTLAVFFHQAKERFLTIFTLVLPCPTLINFGN